MVVSIGLSGCEKGIIGVLEDFAIIAATAS
jgi:hypothetical protein